MNKIIFLYSLLCNQKEMRKYFVDAEMTGMIGSAYEATESLEVLKKNFGVKH